MTTCQISGRLLFCVIVVGYLCMSVFGVLNNFRAPPRMSGFIHIAVKMPIKGLMLIRNCQVRWPDIGTDQVPHLVMDFQGKN